MPKSDRPQRPRASTAVDLSSFARAVTFSSEHERVDVSGFNATGRERVPRRRHRAVSRGRVLRLLRGPPRSTHTLYPIHRDREIVAFEWRPDQVAAVSRDEPAVARGTCSFSQLLAGCHQGRRRDLDSHVHRRGRGRARLRHRPLMPLGSTYRVDGYRELSRALAVAPRC